jgi:hypothetical protein
MFGRKKKDANAEWMSGAQPVTPAAGPPMNFQGGDMSAQIQAWGGTAPTQEQIDQAMGMAERFMGRDLDGDGKIAGQDPEGDVVGQLERLAALKTSGALTEEEFAAQKAKLLGQP